MTLSVVITFFGVLWGGLVIQMIKDPFSSVLIDNYQYCLDTCDATLTVCESKCSYLNLEQGPKKYIKDPLDILQNDTPTPTPIKSSN